MSPTTAPKEALRQAQADLAQVNRVSIIGRGDRLPRARCESTDCRRRHPRQYVLAMAYKAPAWTFGSSTPSRNCTAAACGLAITLRAGQAFT